ncbi:MAG: cation diffusion facilitator family transporter [Candidatus Dadabacteria bacterium]|jgi:cation diffusion facilitator family transporter|nr:cation diffusion facilitator family transporter [Candidatus Dadabacteria bacterium]MCZ6685644.1 cation diffusion facilitator family transporter [Candidatus Dadabacteria bacterium]
MATGSKKVIYVALIGNALIAIIKFIAAAITGSSAMLSEAIHSLVDTCNQVLLLYGLKRAQRPPDKNFPFGYGKEIYFWSFIVAILIFALGAGISIYEGIIHLLHPKPITTPYINYIVIGFAMMFEGFAWYFAFKAFTKSKGKWSYIMAVQKGKDPSILVVLFEDSAALIGLVVAFLGIFLGQVTGIVYFDGAASIIIGLILAGTATWLAYETKGLLIGESANDSIVQGIRELASGHDYVEHVNEVLTLHMGPDFILVNISLDFMDEATADEIETTVEKLDKEIKKNYLQVKRVFVEAEARKSSNPEKLPN